MRKPKRRLRLAMAALFFCLLAYLGIGLWHPEWVLQAEYARQRLFAHAQRKAVQVGDHRIVYLEAGRGRTIVLLHGFTGSKENWLPLMARLRGSYRVIAPDLPGWGESTRLRGADYGPVAQAERVRELLLVLQGAAPSTGGGATTHSVLLRPYRPPTLVVGHSMGGQVLGLLAASHPDAVNRIVLMDAAGVPFKANGFGRDVLAGRNPFEVRTRADLHRFMHLVFADPPWAPWPADEALARMRARQASFEQSVLDGIGRGPQALLLATRLGQIQSPTLLLWCRGDRVIDVSAVDAYRAGIRDTRTVLLDGCGHMPMMEQPDPTTAAIESFLRRPLRVRHGPQSTALVALATGKR
jgi:pimeloyl-ACP methyl ester carboxylesterase